MMPEDDRENSCSTSQDVNDISSIAKLGVEFSVHCENRRFRFMRKLRAISNSNCDRAELDEILRKYHNELHLDDNTYEPKKLVDQICDDLVNNQDMKRDMKEFASSIFDYKAVEFLRDFVPVFSGDHFNWEENLHVSIALIVCGEILPLIERNYMSHEIDADTLSIIRNELAHSNVFTIAHLTGIYEFIFLQYWSQWARDGLRDLRSQLQQIETERLKHQKAPEAYPGINIDLLALIRLIIELAGRASRDVNTTQDLNEWTQKDPKLVQEKLAEYLKSNLKNLRRQYSSHPTELKKEANLIWDSVSQLMSTTDCASANSYTNDRGSKTADEVGWTKVRKSRKKLIEDRETLVIAFKKAIDWLKKLQQNFSKRMDRSSSPLQTSTNFWACQMLLSSICGDLADSFHFTDKSTWERLRQIRNNYMHATPVFELIMGITHEDIANELLGDIKFTIETFNKNIVRESLKLKKTSKDNEKEERRRQLLESARVANKLGPGNASSGNPVSSPLSKRCEYNNYVIS